MANRRKGELKSSDEISKVLAEEKKSKGRQRVYSSADPKKHENLAISLQEGTDLVRNIDPANILDMNDIEAVRDRTVEYFAACEKAGAYPSVMGLAVHGYGMTRENLSLYLRTHNNDTTAYIGMVKDVMADILSNASLNYSAAAIPVIFQLKNHHGFVDKVEVETTTNILGDAMSDEDLRKLADRYSKDAVDVE